MNLLLGKFSNINNIDLQNLINYYQNYFIFETDKTDTFLYLDTKVLKNYLKKGLDIKHRKFIFLFLKDQIKNINSKYKILKNISYITIKYNSTLNYLDEYDKQNLELIINLSNKINKKYNKFSIKDKNIVKLANKLYANVELNRFYLKKIKDNVYRFNGLIINYKNNIKNKILSLLSIEYINKINKKKFININLNHNKELILKTNCTLILSDNNDEWENILNLHLPTCTYKIISTKNNFKNIVNKDILKLDFLIISTNVITSIYYKNYFKKYENLKSDIYLSIINSVHDNLYNVNIENEIFGNLYIFKWNNIIYDNILKIKNNDKYNLINYLVQQNVKYYILNDNLDNNILNYVIKNSITSLNGQLNNDITLEYDITNFYNFLSNELVIKCNYEIVKINYNFIRLILSEDEKLLYSKLFEDNKSEFKSIFFLQYYQCNFEYTNIDDIFLKIETYYNNLINKDYDKIFFLENLFNNKDTYINNDNYKNLYFFDILMEKSNDDIKNIINDIKNNIDSYKLKIDYCKNMLNNIKNIQCNCTICIDNINKNNMCVLNCGHYFCTECILKYIYQKNDSHECPMCRDKFNINNIYTTNNYNNKKYGTKINKLIEMIKTSNNKKILIITQYNKIINKITEIFNNENIKSYHMFYQNNFLKDKNIKQFELCEDKVVLLCNYEDLNFYSYKYINDIYFLDYLEDKNNIFDEFKNKLLYNIYYENSIINIIFLYISDSLEEKIIDKYIKY